MCDRCRRAEHNGAKRGVYIKEIWHPDDRDKERSFGPFATKGCAAVAVWRGAIRSRVYTMGRYTAQQARAFHPNAIGWTEATRLRDRAEMLKGGEGRRRSKSRSRKHRKNFT